MTHKKIPIMGQAVEQLANHSNPSLRLEIDQHITTKYYIEWTVPRICIIVQIYTLERQY